MAVTWDKALYDQLYKAPSWPWGVRHGPNGKRAPTFHYHWRVQQPRLQRLVEHYINVPGFAQISDVAIVGGGFGWTAELLSNYGINAISVETGDYVLTNQATSEEGELRQAMIDQGLDPDNLPNLISQNDPNAFATTNEVWSHWLRPDGRRNSNPVVEEDLSTNGSRRSVRQALGNNIDAIVSEFLLDSMSTEAEVLSVAESCHQLRPTPACTVLHVVGDDTLTDPRFITGPLSYWRNLLDTGGFTDHKIVSQNGVVV